MREIKDWQSIVAALIAYFVMGSVWVAWGFKVINWVNRK